MSKFQDFVTNKQILELQEQLDQVKIENEKLKKYGSADGEIEESYFLRSQLIKCQDENLQLKKLITSLNKQKGKYSHMDQFFSYFNVPNVQAIGVKLQSVIDQFINLRQENEEKNQKLLELSQLQIEYRELLTKVTILEQQLQIKENQLERAEKQLKNLSKMVETRREDERRSFWNLEVLCDTLKQLIGEGWKCELNNEENQIEKIVVVISQHYNLLNKVFKQSINDNHAYFKIENGTLHILKHIECSYQPISTINKQVEALDEFWIMFALLNNYPINILNQGETILVEKVQKIQKLLNSQSAIYINQMVPYQMEINFLNIRFQIAQFAQQSLDWFFEKKDENVLVSDYNKTIKLSAQAKVKWARETTQLHYITDYYQVTQDNRLMLCIQSSLQEQPIVKKYQINQGVIAKIKIGENFQRVCKVINTEITSDTTIQKDENYIFIYL